MLYSQEWIEKQRQSKTFMDPRIHKKVVIITLACLNFLDRNISRRFQSAAAAKGSGYLQSQGSDPA